MKAIKSTLLLFTLAGIISCGKISETNQASRNEKSEAHSKKIMTEKDEIEALNMNALYHNLDMHPRQITLFENEYHRSMKNLRRENETVSLKEMKQQRGKLLKSILSSDQFRIYRIWQKEHPDS